MKYKGKYKIAISFYILIGLIAMLAIFIFKTKVARAEEEPPKVVFTNRNDNKVTLDFTKEVTTTSGVAPDDTFAFLVEFGKDENSLSPLAGTLYHKINANGEELFQWSGRIVPEGKTEEEDVVLEGTEEEFKDKEGFTQSNFKTDSNGYVYLKAGQIASFEDLKVNYYFKISENMDYLIEDETVSGENRGTYEKLTADQSGTFTQDGVDVNFVNRYSPPPEDTPVTDITIYKYIERPKGFELSDEDLGEFNFKISLNDKPLGEAEYTVYDLNDNYVEKGQTDLAGTFKMRGDCYAVFKEIDTGKQLDVYESTDDASWWAIPFEGEEISPGDGYIDLKSTETEGDNTIVSFKNTKYSFIVYKTVERKSDTPEDELESIKNQAFTFEITDENGMGLSGVPYYLYDATKNKVSEELYYTDAIGRFDLFDGQRALFIGIKRDKVVNIAEVSNPSYEQVSPADLNGYTNQVIKDSVQEYKFINKLIKSTSLSVTKELVDPTGTIDKTARYTFVLYKLDKSVEPNEYKKVPKAKFNITVNGIKESRETDAYGCFTLAPNETAYFTSLTFGTYKVAEIDLNYDDFREDSFKVKIDNDEVKYNLSYDVSSSNETGKLISCSVDDISLLGDKKDVVFRNKKHIDYTLSQSGGKGIEKFLYIGAAIMLIGIIILYKVRKKRAEI